MTATLSKAKILLARSRIKETLPLRKLPFTILFLRAYQCFCPCLANKDKKGNNVQPENQLDNEKDGAQDQSKGKSGEVSEKLLALARVADENL